MGSDSGKVFYDYFKNWALVLARGPNYLFYRPDIDTWAYRRQRGFLSGSGRMDKLILIRDADGRTAVVTAMEAETRSQRNRWDYPVYYPVMPKYFRKLALKKMQEGHHDHEE